MNQKVCTLCQSVKDLEMFGHRGYKLKSGEFTIGYKSRCKTCETSIQRNRRNQEKAKDPVKYHQRWADYYDRTKEHNKEMKQHWIENPENRKARNEYVREYKAKKRALDPNFKLYENLRKRVWKCLKNKSNSSKELLGCDINDYRKWIEYTMDDQMNWKNYGTYWNIDHILPIDSFDLTNPIEAKNAFNWKNTWAMIQHDNFSKRSSINDELIRKHKQLLDQYCKENNISYDLKSTICSQASIKVEEGSTTR